MKKHYRFLLIALVASMFLTGCGKLDVEFDADFRTNLNVDVPSADLKISAGYPFSASNTIDPMSDSDFARYADKIKNVEIREVVAEVISLNKPVVLLACKLNVTSYGYTGAEWNFEDKSIEVGTTFSLGNENGQWDNIRKMLNDKKELTVSVEGETDQDDVQFILRVTINTDVTSSPL